MYQGFQNLGVSGHRLLNSYSFPNPYPGVYHQAPMMGHGHSRSMCAAPLHPMYLATAHPLQPMHPHPMHPHPHYYQYAPAPASAPAPAPAPAPAEEVNGGINSVLEYDLNRMATFLSWCAFGMLKQNRNPSKEFESLMVSVLFATRLPKSTIIIALEYMNQRFSSKTLADLSESDVFTTLTIALILANKFNDDNTFTNRSWCGATGLKIEVLNHEERVWLAEVKWQLNVVKFKSNIRTLEECWKAWLDKYAPAQIVVPESPVSSTFSLSPAAIMSSPVMAHDYYYQQPPTHYTSIPSSPIYTPPQKTSPYKYDSIWNDRYQPNIWSYTSGPYPSRPTCNDYTGYSNPYYYTATC